MPIGLIEVLNILHAKIKLAAFPGIFSNTIKHNLSEVLFFKTQAIFDFETPQRGKMQC